ncbi:hypothetical protein [Hymenobacter cellulosivorans]|uniref:Uncharacterized protein n=1 Tax=Hymenobacter cellulosivorans TaxID=2932249 RepID=A0ABY4F8U1_9BACT|nr:hypothetical protein [Hymenobacter cellulosivorans]UOQ53095.1 hypothetical protein MUN80_25595 [Hymenobacter cellulosivorans]
MKTIGRLLPLAALLVCNAPVAVEAAAPVSTSAASVAARGNFIDTYVKIAVRNYAAANNLPQVTYVYDSQTDFRVYSAGVLVDYGYADLQSDGTYDVYIGGVLY